MKLHAQDGFRRYVVHQIAWVVIAIMINLYSIWRVSIGEQALTATNPGDGIFVFLLYTPFLYLAWDLRVAAYYLVTALFVLLILWSGVFRHLTALFTSAELDGYSSLYALLLAVAVNLYGITVSVLALSRVRVQRTSGEFP